MGDIAAMTMMIVVVDVVAELVDADLVDADSVDFVVWNLIILLLD